MKQVHIFRLIKVETVSSVRLTICETLGSFVGSFTRSFTGSGPKMTASE